MERGRKHTKPGRSGCPLVIRPAYTLGGTGGGIAQKPRTSSLAIVESGAWHASPISQVLLERSLVGWKEVEYEVIRDGADNCITVCNMENFDPDGRPHRRQHRRGAQPDADRQGVPDAPLRPASRSSGPLGIEGGCNIQLALRPHPDAMRNRPGDWDADSDYYVIEVNPQGLAAPLRWPARRRGIPIARVVGQDRRGQNVSTKFPTR